MTCRQDFLYCRTEHIAYRTYNIHVHIFVYPYYRAEHISQTAIDDAANVYKRFRISLACTTLLQMKPNGKIKTVWMNTRDHLDVNVDNVLCLMICHICMYIHCMSIYLSVYLSIHLCIYLHTHARTHTHTLKHTCMYECMYVCMQACMHA